MSARKRAVRRHTGRNPGFNMSWWSLYKAAITGLCGTTTHQDEEASATLIACRAAQIADSCWNVWVGRQSERATTPGPRETKESPKQ